MGTEKGKAILVVEADEFIRLAVEEYCSGYAPTVSVSTVQDAIEALGRDLVAVVLGIHPADESALCLLEKIRARDALLPILIYTNGITSTVAHLAARYQAELLGRSDNLSRLKKFITRSVRVHRASQPRLPTVKTA